MAEKPRTFLREYKSVSYQFTAEPPDILLCSICFGVLNDPQQAICCGKVFCRRCIQNAIARYRYATCPCCRQAIQTFPDKRTEQDVGNLQVVCPNDWCKRRVELREVENHKVACTSKLVLCEFSGMGCPRKGPRQDIERHAKEDVVQHLDLCRKKIEQLETALGGQVQGGEVVSRAAKGVAKVKPSFPVVIIPIDDYQLYKESNCVWERAEFELAGKTFFLRLQFYTPHRRSITIPLFLQHTVWLKYCDQQKSVDDNKFITGRIEVFSDHSCNSLILKTHVFQVAINKREFINIAGFNLDDSQIPKNMYLKIQILQFT